MMFDGRARVTSRSRASDNAPVSRQVFSEDDFLAMRARLERMSETELACFRVHPANRLVLQQYDRFAVRQVLPYAAALVALTLVSLVLAWSLSA